MPTTALPTDSSTGWGNGGWAEDIHDVVAAGLHGGAVLVAGDDAPAEVKLAARYICDGTNDEEQINDAIEVAAPDSSHDGTVNGEGRGTVILVGQDFMIDDDPVLMRTGVILRGLGPITRLNDGGSLAASGAGTTIGVIMKNDANVHICSVQDMQIYGRYASGTTNSCGIAYSGSGGGSLGDYPTTSPDTYDHFKGLYIWGFTNDGTRHGIYLENTSMRGTVVEHVVMREIGNHGFWTNGSPDGQMINCEIGGCGGDGFRFNAGNWRLVGSKAFYCGGWGCRAANQRFSAAGNEIQDCENGVFVAGRQAHSGWVIDNCDTTGMEIDGDHSAVTGFSIFHRSGGRYANMDVGLLLSNTPSDVVVHGVVDPTDITTGTSGSAGSRTSILVPDGSSVFTG